MKTLMRLGWLSAMFVLSCCQAFVDNLDREHYSRSDAKNLLIAMQYKTGAAIASYGIGLALAMASAAVLGVHDAQ